MAAYSGEMQEVALAWDVGPVGCSRGSAQYAVQDATQDLAWTHCWTVMDFPTSLSKTMLLHSSSLCRKLIFQIVLAFK